MPPFFRPGFLGLPPHEIIRSRLDEVCSWHVGSLLEIERFKDQYTQCRTEQVLSILRSLCVLVPDAIFGWRDVLACLAGWLGVCRADGPVRARSQGDNLDKLSGLLLS